MKSASQMAPYELMDQKRKSSRRKLAEKIARMLFTDGSGRRADRLAMKHGKGVMEREGGGWCESAAADRIEEMLLSNDQGQTRSAQRKD